MNSKHFTEDEIRQIAEMARVHIPNEEMQHYADMTQILTFIDQINEVDTNGVSPMAHPLNIIQRLREDIVTEQNKRDLLMENAADRTEAGVYLVPQVIEGE